MKRELLPVVVAAFFISSVLFEAMRLVFLIGLVSALLRRGLDLTGNTRLGDCGCICPADIWRMTLGAWSSPTLIFLAGMLLLPSSTVLARPTTAMDDRLLTDDDDDDEIDTDLVGEILVESATLVGADSFDDLITAAVGLGIWDRPTAPTPPTVVFSVCLTVVMVLAATTRLMAEDLTTTALPTCSTDCFSSTFSAATAFSSFWTATADNTSGSFS